MDAELVELGAVELDEEAGVGSDAPFVLVAALGGEAVEIFAVGPPRGAVGVDESAAARLEGIMAGSVALAEAAFADDEGTLVVLKAGGDDLAAAGAVVVDEAGHR